MTEPVDTVEHLTRRLLALLPEPYEKARLRFEELVPEFDPAAFRAASSWQATLDLVATHAPHGFMRYLRLDIAPVMVHSESRWTATQYLMGNHTIAERMFRHDPAVMLHAPLRVLLYADRVGDTRLAVDQPSLLFGSYGNPDIAAVGRELDQLLARLISLLGGTLPAALR
jgi:hypothetical protein